MKILKLFFFGISLLLSGMAISADTIDEDITNPGTGTFSIDDVSGKPQQRMETEKQLEMEREEEELDGFGEDKYNYNSDPEVYMDEENQ